MSHRQPLRTFQVLAHHPAVRALMTAASAAGAAGVTPCHLVGGVLRDRLLGLPSHDIDAVVAGRGREIALQLAADLPARFVALGGKEFAAFRLVGEGFEIDLWDRGETSLRDDLERRDFTVNAIAFEPRAGLVFDPFGGLADLDRRALRAVSPRSFTADPLRVLRLPRLVLQLPGFAAGPATLGLARAAARELAGVAAERVRAELALIFAQPEAHRGLALLAALDLYPGLWLGAPGEPGGTRAAGHLVQRLEALPLAVRYLRQLSPRLAEAVRPATARMATAFAALPAGSAAPPAHLARFRDAGYLSRAEAEEIDRLLAERELPADALGRRRFLHRTAELWPTAVVYLGALALTDGAEGDESTWRQRLRPLAELALREGETIVDPPRLLQGGEVGEILGIAPGPRVGQALSAVREAQIEGRVRTREEALRLVRSLPVLERGDQGGPADATPPDEG